MTKEHHTLYFDVEVDYSCTLDFDDGEGLVFTSYHAALGDDDPEETITSVSGLVDTAIESAKFSHDYTTMYCMAHESTRFAEQMTDIAHQMEDDTLIEDLFNVDINDLPEVDD